MTIHIVKFKKVPLSDREIAIRLLTPIMLVLREEHWNKALWADDREALANAGGVLAIYLRHGISEIPETVEVYALYIGDEYNPQVPLNSSFGKFVVSHLEYDVDFHHDCLTAFMSEPWQGMDFVSGHKKFFKSNNDYGGLEE